MSGFYENCDAVESSAMRRRAENVMQALTSSSQPQNRLFMFNFNILLKKVAA
jgi:hypothetical protein